MSKARAPQALLKHVSPLLLQGLDALHEGLIIIDENANIVYLNTACATIFGVDPQQACGCLVTDVIADTRLPKVLFTGQAEKGYQQVLGRHNYKVSHYPIHNTGKIVGAIGTIRHARDLSIPLATASNNGPRTAKKCPSIATRYSGTRWQLADIVGGSEAILELNEKIYKVASGDASVLIRGESGTGKELYAHALHRLSERSQGPFIKLNCAAIPEHLLEAELFGYEEGAFTGARKGGKPGKFQLAHGGTLFLDEIGDMPLSMQVKLLRVLQDREVEAVGATRLVSVDVRVIAATHRPLESLVQRGEFREDLFYRINVVPLAIPPLRERREDIPLLVRHILSRLSERNGRHCPALSEAAMACLYQHSWPGNIRELENVLEAAFYLGGSHLDAEDLPEPLRNIQGAAPVQATSLKDSLMQAERNALKIALAESGGSRIHAARILGISKSSFYQKLARHGLYVDAQPAV